MAVIKEDNEVKKVLSQSSKIELGKQTTKDEKSKSLKEKSHPKGKEQE